MTDSLHHHPVMAHTLVLLGTDMVRSSQGANPAYLKNGKHAPVRDQKNSQGDPEHRTPGKHHCPPSARDFCCARGRGWERRPGICKPSKDNCNASHGRLGSTGNSLLPRRADTTSCIPAGRTGREAKSCRVLMLPPRALAPGSQAEMHLRRALPRAPNDATVIVPRRVCF